MCMCMCFVYAYVDMYAYVYAHVHTATTYCVYACMYYICICVCMHTHVYIYVCIAPTRRVAWLTMMYVWSGLFCSCILCFAHVYRVLLMYIVFCSCILCFAHVYCVLLMYIVVMSWCIFCSIRVGHAGARLWSLVGLRSHCWFVFAALSLLPLSSCWGLPLYCSFLFVACLVLLLCLFRAKFLFSSCHLTHSRWSTCVVGGEWEDSVCKGERERGYEWQLAVCYWLGWTGGRSDLLEWW